MVTRLVAVLGVLCLIAFAVLWPPAALLIAGVALLLLSLIRSRNESEVRRRGPARNS